MWTVMLAAAKAAWAWALPYAGPVIAVAAPWLAPLRALNPSRRGVGIAALMLAIGVSAWWLWPRAGPPDVRVERFAVGVSRQTVEHYKAELARATAAAAYADAERQRADEEEERAIELARQLEAALAARAGAATAVCFPPDIVTMINQSRTGRKVKP